MNHRILTPIALALGLFTGAALAQATAPAAAASSPAKKELVAKLLKLQQPGIENLARELTLKPALNMLNQAGMALQANVPPEKREAVAKDIDADLNKYASEAVPLVRERAIKLAPSTMGKLLEDRLNEDELKQVIAILESPAYGKYVQLGAEQQKALLEKVAAEMKATIDPKLKTLNASIGKRLTEAAGAPAPAAPGASKPAK